MSNIVKSPSDDLIRGGQYLESPIFYMGNKYKLLKQLMPLFPTSCEVFVDLFGGSGVVSMNYHGTRQTIYNEYNINIYELIKLFATHSFEELDAYFQSVVDKYDLQTGLKRNMFDSEEAFLADTDAKKIRYNKFREDYNKSLQKDYRDLWVLSVFSCNHLIRFNTKNEFNASFGSNGNYNDNLKKKVQNGCTALKNLTLCNEDALTLDLSNLTDKDFVYCDPPYTNTTAVYNEKRAFGGWTVDNDKALFAILESLDKRGVKWGLSNVFVCRGKKNEHLIKWCEEHNWNVHHLSRNYNPFSRGNSENDEVYICNYDNVEPENRPITLYHGDCLEILRDIPDNSIDMILCDLPYQETGNKWDKFVDLKRLFAEYRRIIKEDGCIALNGTFKFGVHLYNIAPDLYKYEWVWEKDNGTNAPNVNYQPFRVHEFVFIFGKGRVTNGTRVPMKYFPQKTEGKPYKQKSGRVSENWKGGLKNVITDNVDGFRHPKTIQKFNRDKGFHSTQKPVALLEFLIKSYTKEGDLVLDNCMGSGSTGVACVHTNRKFIGIELEDKYFNIAVKRIEEAKK